MWSFSCFSVFVHPKATTRHPAGPVWSSPLALDGVPLLFRFFIDIYAHLISSAFLHPRVSAFLFSVFLLVDFD